MINYEFIIGQALSELTSLPTFSIMMGVITHDDLNIPQNVKDNFPEVIPLRVTWAAMPEVDLENEVISWPTHFNNAPTVISVPFNLIVGIHEETKGFQMAIPREKPVDGEKPVVKITDHVGNGPKLTIIECGGLKSENHEAIEARKKFHLIDIKHMELDHEV